jgi:hypothetical protein
MALSPPAASAKSVAEDACRNGDSKIKALEVFFCRREYVLSAVFKRAAVGDDSNVKLPRSVSRCGYQGGEDGAAKYRILAYTGGVSPSNKATSSGGSSRSL